MIFGILTMLVALTISGIAAYYSIIGLTAIFAAAFLPIVLMGGVLEIGKVVTAVWLHANWNKARFWMKSYLLGATVVLMFITSMGIFGFLSKAHIEQTAASQESVAQVEKLTKEIARNEAIVARSTARIETLEKSGTGAAATVQQQIDKEQSRIDSAYERIQPAIDEQNKIIAGVTGLYQSELDKIDEALKTLQGYIDNGEVKKVQQMIGASADGIFGKNTAEKIGDWKNLKQKERAEWVNKIQAAGNSPTVKAARDEIARLRASAEKQVAESNKLINTLRDQIRAADNAQQIQTELDENNARIKEANAQIDTLTTQKYELEAEYRKLEAEVGPVKYIAEFIYGEQATTSILEEAVRWVIVTIIFVFDPLAIILILAGAQQIQWARNERKPKEEPVAKIEPGANDLDDIIAEANQEASNQSFKKGVADRAKEENDLLDVQKIEVNLEEDIEFINKAADEVLAAVEEFERKEEQLNTAPEVQNTVEEELHENTGTEVSNNLPERVEEPNTTQNEESTQESYENDSLVAKVEAPSEVIHNEPVEEVAEPTSNEAVVEAVQEVEHINLKDNFAPQDDVKPSLTGKLRFAYPDEDGDGIPDDEDPDTLERAVIKHQLPPRPAGKVLQTTPLYERDLSTHAAVKTGFGSVFPDQDLQKGDLFLRDDYMPSRLFKWNGDKWIEVSKENSGHYAFDVKYIEHLISKIQTGEYDVDDLSDTEQDQIRDYLLKNVQ